jgi:hypothetical protein
VAAGQVGEVDAGEAEAVDEALLDGMGDRVGIVVSRDVVPHSKVLGGVAGVEDARITAIFCVVTGTRRPG